MDDGATLTEAEKMLLLMCQKEASANQSENGNIKVSDIQMQEINQTSSTSLNQGIHYIITEYMSMSKFEKVMYSKIIFLYFFKTTRL